MEKVRPMYEQFKGWAEEFRLASIEQKKMIISQVTSRIELGKGYKIRITLNMEYEQFFEGGCIVVGQKNRIIYAFGINKNILILLLEYDII